MLEKMNPVFVRIPNVIMYDTKIVPNAKYLYGIIDMLSYYTETITNEELSSISQISHNSIEKYLKQLKDNNYITIERKRNSRKITPLILHSLEIETQQKREKENEIKQVENDKRIKNLIEQQKIEKMNEEEKEKYKIQKQLAKEFWNKII